MKRIRQILTILPQVVASGWLARAEEETESMAVGGQAVLEGVMMRSPDAIAVAVRRPVGDVLVKLEPYLALSKRIRFWHPPLLRGIAALWESLTIGMRILNWSAEIASEDEPGSSAAQEEKWWNKLLNLLMIVVAFGLGLGLFVYLPYLVSGFIQPGSNPIIFHIIAGLMRIALLIGYLWAISLARDIRRLFMYHGAEHKSIAAFEQQVELTADNAERCSRFHPRCGTSFVLIVALMTMVVFMLIDALIIALAGDYSSALHRLVVHIPFIPLVAGFSFEILKISARYQGSWLGRQIVKPGLWLQRITTREPDSPMLEVALVALSTSLNHAIDPQRAVLHSDSEQELPG
ncbi:MAG: DUF1385 domain-containing protein [Candidatus Delongbacteria bacterium]|nr:DUF1385 domain-containing protein [Candidatus Delongbacteria bacterium]